MKIRQVNEKYFSHSSSVSVNFTIENPTIQNLDTSILSLLHGNDECGKVQNFVYTEDNVVNIYDDDMERVTQTEHELAYYDGLATNVVANSVSSSENPSSMVDNAGNVQETLQTPASSD